MCVVSSLLQKGAGALSCTRQTDAPPPTFFLPTSVSGWDLFFPCLPSPDWLGRADSPQNAGNVFPHRWLVRGRTCTHTMAPSVCRSDYLIHPTG